MVRTKPARWISTKDTCSDLICVAAARGEPAVPRKALHHVKRPAHSTSTQLLSHTQTPHMLAWRGCKHSKARRETRAPTLRAGVTCAASLWGVTGRLGTPIKGTRPLRLQQALAGGWLASAAPAQRGFPRPHQQAQRLAPPALQPLTPPPLHVMHMPPMQLCARWGHERAGAREVTGQSMPPGATSAGCGALAHAVRIISPACWRVLAEARAAARRHGAACAPRAARQRTRCAELPSCQRLVAQGRRAACCMVARTEQGFLGAGCRVGSSQL
jgi:hypothetical protein